MLETYFVKPQTVVRMRACSIGAEIERYAGWLAERGYSARTARRHVQALVAFGEFARLRGALVSADLPAHVDDFVAMRVAGYRRGREAGTEVCGPVEQMLAVVLPGFERADRPRRELPFVRAVPGFFGYWPTSAACARSRSWATGISWPASRLTWAGSASPACGSCRWREARPAGRPRPQGRAFDRVPVVGRGRRGPGGLHAARSVTEHRPARVLAGFGAGGPGQQGRGLRVRPALPAQGRDRRAPPGVAHAAAHLRPAAGRRRFQVRGDRGLRRAPARRPPRRSTPRSPSSRCAGLRSATGIRCWRDRNRRPRGRPVHRAQAAHGRKYHSEARELALLVRFAAGHDISWLGELTPALLEDFLASRPRPHPRSFNHLLGVVRCLLDWAFTWGLPEASPLAGPPPARCRGRVARWPAGQRKIRGWRGGPVVPVSAGEPAAVIATRAAWPRARRYPLLSPGRRRWASAVGSGGPILEWV